MLRAELKHRFGEFELQAELAASSSSTLVLVGESGAGKTTLLRFLAGLLRPAGGRLEVNGSTWFSRNPDVELPAWRRPVGFVGQRDALFPHLDVRANVAFGLTCLGLSKAIIRERVDRMLEALRIGDLRDRRPSQLSGGQRQRVALARALVLQPRLLLLDEPLSALDVSTRSIIRQEIRAQVAESEAMAVVVTHNPLEALIFGDAVAVLEAGRATQVGTRDDLLLRPRSRYIAEFMGVNLFTGVLAGRPSGGLDRLRTRDGELSVVDLDAGYGELFVSVNPREITLHREAPGGSAQNVFSGPILELIPEPPHGERVRVSLGTHPPLVAEVTRHAVETLGLVPGTRVFASFKASGVVPYR